MSDSSAAYDAALRFLASRPRSEAEVRRRLQRGGRFSAEAIAGTLERLNRNGLLDDAAFARYWLEQRQTFRPRGARLLQAELRQRGVGATLAQTVTTDLPAADEDAYRAASKRAHQLAELDQRTFASRLSSFLARRGFDWDTIGPVVNRLWAEVGEPNGQPADGQNGQGGQ